MIERQTISSQLNKIGLKAGQYSTTKLQIASKSKKTWVRARIKHREITKTLRV